MPIAPPYPWMGFDRQCNCVCHTKEREMKINTAMDPMHRAVNEGPKPAPEEEKHAVKEPNEDEEADPDGEEEVDEEAAAVHTNKDTSSRLSRRQRR
jgi:hypothetical protein